ncbi:IclR family transcriptional regulator [Mycobacterium sp. NAZ190054]|uniref:IclR family transcriptional regulator n=1 Tax=Mycobacterium sp. NAZ190054 TaxID=1747766 RepID=UPI0007975E9B|nr:helix-turn-helix domain-containing protein [Mycobacterium sp. NAZ190054]KWX56993.1 IclR family transcriptional regulator [Mycobacterium sp. NAZ190054]
MIDRIAAIMEFVARSESRGVSLTDIAHQIDAPVSSTQGLVNGLVATGYLDVNGRRYVLGAAPYLLNLIAGRQLVASVTHEDLNALHAEVGMTTVLSIAVGHDVFYVDHCSVDPRFAYLAENYVRRSLIRTSSGWVLLADWDKRDLWTYLKSLGADDAGRVDSFLRGLSSIRETGISAAPHASEHGDGVSIAVRERGRTVAAVAVVGTPAEIDKHRERIISALRRHSAQWLARSPLG